MRLSTTARTTQAPTHWLRSAANKIRIASKDRAEARDRALALASGPTVADRQLQLVEFYRQYEDLVETLCDAAQYGPTPKLSSSYNQHRVWMNENYSPVRRYVVAFLRFAVEDARAGLGFDSKGADAFEALVAAPSLEEFLQHDDGCMISRISRTREALTLYAEHLRQLNSSL